KQFFWKTIVLISIALLIGCSAAGKLIKSGDEAVARGDHFTAANNYISALSTDPTHRIALEKLSLTVRPAYEQKLRMAEGYKAQNNLESALTEYKELKNFIRRVKNYITLNFVPIDIAQAIKEVSAGAAEKHYQIAENLYKQSQYEKAIREYKTVLDFTNPYKDTDKKIADSYYIIASNYGQSKHYRSAANNYKYASKRVRGYKDAAQRAATIYYNLGTYFLSKKQCRKAFEDLSEAKKLSPQFSSVDKKLSKAKECATVKIAFVKFDNTTGRNLAGMELGDFIFETIKTKVQNQASQFIRMLDREQLLVLAQEQQISTGYLDLDSGSAGSINLEGVHYLVFGKINQVRVVHPGLSKNRVSDKYSYSVKVPYVDKNGKRRTEIKWREGTMLYSIYEDKLSVTISGSIRIVEAKTGVVIINHQISEHQSDEIMYANNFSAPHDLSSRSVSYSSDIHNLSNARRELKDVGVFANRITESIANDMTRKILSKLDRTPSISDPTNLTF
ncbi:MAG: hypothetical protein GWP19_06160, partial [Planctomycetia bacterium]|nr:hypothetical protein [Planctomycetia bacterium]